MKRVLILLSVLWLTQSTYAFANEINVRSTIHKVKVFRQGAQITRLATSNIPTGQTLLKFTDLSPDFDYESIQLKSDGDFTIFAVNVHFNFLNQQKPSQAYLQLNFQADSLQIQLKREQVLLALWKEEESMILANKNLDGSEGASADKLTAMTDFYRKNLRDVKFKILDSNTEIERLNREISQLRSQMNKMNTQHDKTHEIWVTVSADAATAGSFALSYVIKNAGWDPAYDCRIEEINQPIHLTYKAQIYQTSGEDWQNVELSLSSGNPKLSAQKPEFDTWRLGFWEGPILQYDTVNTFDPETYEEPFKIIRNEIYPEGMLEEKTTTFEYKIEQPYDIPSDGEPYILKVNEYEVSADFEYYTAPKFDPTAYLTARVKDWEQYNLLSGDASLFFEGTFLGKTFIDTKRTVDTLTLSLGRDEGVVVTRKKDVQNSSDQFIGSKKTEVRGWDIELRNTKKQAINIVIEDQYPIATNEDIEVTLDSARNAEVDKESGKLKWTVTLKPGQSEKLTFLYSVKYPKRKRVILE